MAQKYFTLKSDLAYTYTGDATHLTIYYQKRDWGQLDPLPITFEQVQQKLQEITNQTGVKFIKVEIWEDEPQEVFMGWERNIRFEIIGIQDSPIAVAVIAVILGIIGGLVLLWGLNYVSHIVETIFYSPVGQGVGDIAKQVANYFPLVLITIGGIMLYRWQKSKGGAK